MKKSVTLPEETIFEKIYLIRDQKVLLDVDLDLKLGRLALPSDGLYRVRCSHVIFHPE